MESPPSANLGIAAVERETGLSKDVLRKWEMRYGFPVPLRDALGERAYPAAQVRRLRLIKRLMDGGMRPSRVVHLDESALAALAQEAPPTRPTRQREVGAAASIALLQAQDPEGLRQHLNRELLRHGVEVFVLEILAPLNQAIGEAWARGEISVHQEHVYTEVVQGLLRNTAAQFSCAAGAPRILLTTLPEEQHGLGILMVATLFSLHGAYCLSLGTQTPVFDIVLAARMHRVDIVALSFSVAYPARRIQPALEELRRDIGGQVALWAGGAGSGRLAVAPSGVVLMPTLERALAALAGWQEEKHGQGAVHE